MANFSETFTGGSGTALTAHTPDSGGGAYVLTGNAAAGNLDGSGHFVCNAGSVTGAWLSTLTSTFSDFAAGFTVTFPSGFTGQLDLDIVDAAGNYFHLQCSSLGIRCFSTTVGNAFTLMATLACATTAGSVIVFTMSRAGATVNVACTGGLTGTWTEPTVTGLISKIGPQAQSAGLMLMSAVSLALPVLAIGTIAASCTHVGGASPSVTANLTLSGIVTPTGNKTVNWYDLPATDGTPGGGNLIATTNPTTSTGTLTVTGLTPQTVHNFIATAADTGTLGTIVTSPARPTAAWAFPGPRVLVVCTGQSHTVQMFTDGGVIPDTIYNNTQDGYRVLFWADGRGGTWTTQWLPTDPTNHFITGTVANLASTTTGFGTGGTLHGLTFDLVIHCWEFGVNDVNNGTLNVALGTFTGGAGTSLGNLKVLCDYVEANDPAPINTVPKIHLFMCPVPPTYPGTGALTATQFDLLSRQWPIGLKGIDDGKKYFTSSIDSTAIVLNNASYEGSYPHMTVSGYSNYANALAKNVDLTLRRYYGLLPATGGGINNLVGRGLVL